MRKLIVLAVLALSLGVASPAFADGEPTASVPTPVDTKDVDGEWWRCIEWDSSRGCNTGHYYHDGQGTNWVLWIAPSGHRQWRPATIDVQSDSRYTDVYCPDRV